MVRGANMPQRRGTMKHWKKILLLCLALLMIGFMTSCRREARGGGSLVIYTTTHESNIRRIVPAFEEATGVRVEIITGSAGSLLARIRAERANPQADLMWGGLTPSAFYVDPDLWHPYVSSHNNEFPEDFRSNGYFNNFMIQVINLWVNTALAAELGVQIRGYADLLHPALRGRIIHADPLSSSSAWRHLSTKLLVMGGYESEESWDFIEAFIQNLNGVTTNSSAAVIRQVVEGEFVVGLSYESSCVEMLQSGATNVEIVYMQEGTTASPFAAAIVRNARNLDNAKAFIDWLTSVDTQRGYANESSSRPANAYIVSTNPFLLDYSRIRILPEDQDFLAEHRGAIEARWRELWARHN
jgi:iron(III) transport system substrate-binding protein